MIGAHALPSLKIGDLEINPPIIQGGMGVRVSASRLASAVSNEGCLGVVATVGTGEGQMGEGPAAGDYVTRSYDSLRALLQETKALTSNPIAVNIMRATTNYESLAQASVEENVAAIISGGGLPLNLPDLVKNDRIKLIPVVSSGRAAALICKTWHRKYNHLPDAIIVEGPLAGGHLGYAMTALRESQESSLETVLAEVLEVVETYAVDGKPKIPVITAGGVFDGKDIAHFLSLGASGVQIATRFVCTDECDTSQAYKDAYVNCTKDDIVLIDSPLGLPLRVIRNNFVDRIVRGERADFRCVYHCLVTCNPAKTHYCIAQALINAYQGNMDQGFATCGASAYRINKIVSVHDLVQELVGEAVETLEANK